MQCRIVRAVQYRIVRAGGCPAVVAQWQSTVRAGGCPAVVAQWQSTGGSSQRCPGFDSQRLPAFSLSASLRHGQFLNSALNTKLE